MAVNERFDFSGLSVVITGGGKGIGKVYVEEFAKAGARVAAADIDVDAAKGVAEFAFQCEPRSDRARCRYRRRGVGQRHDRGRAQPLRRDRRAHQQCLADEHAAAPLLAGNPGRGMGPGHGGEFARHVSLLPRRLPGHEGAKARQDRQHLVLAGVGGNAEPPALHNVQGGCHRIYPRARPRGRRVRHHRECRDAGA